MEAIKKIINEKGIGKTIGIGGSATIYRINDSGLAIKVSPLDGFFRPWPNPSPDRMYRGLYKEFVTQSQLYERGISVPKPEGLTWVRSPKTGIFCPSLVMEYIPHTNPHQNPEYERIEKMFWDEVEKAKKVGFIPSFDCDPYNNWLFNSEKNKVYLIDFRFWGCQNDRK